MQHLEPRGLVALIVQPPALPSDAHARGLAVQAAGGIPVGIELEGAHPRRQLFSQGWVRVKPRKQGARRQPPKLSQQHVGRGLVVGVVRAQDLPAVGWAR